VSIQTSLTFVFQLCTNRFVWNVKQLVFFGDNGSMSTLEIAILWNNCPNAGLIDIGHGSCELMKLVQGAGTTNGNAFALTGSEPHRMELRIQADSLSPGALATTVSVRSEEKPFTFFLRDVSKKTPIYIPQYNVAVTLASDSRSFSCIQNDIADKGLKSKFDRIDEEPEESYEQASAHTRKLQAPTWLGVSRDVRIFEVGLRGPMAYADWIQPRFHGHGYFWEEKEYYPPRYGYVAGRGWGPNETVSRRLDSGTLPILHTERIDDDICYEQVSFVTLEKSELTCENIRGTHFLVADGLSVCHAQTEEHKKEFTERCESELAGDEQTVLCVRICATNKGQVPRHAFFKSIHPVARFGDPIAHNFDGEKGFSRHERSDEVFGISRINGEPMGQQEIALLLAPGESVTYEFFMPHSPLPANRAEALAKKDMNKVLEQCKSFWNQKLQTIATVSLPEKRIDEMVKAGFLHLDLVTYGQDPDGTLNATNGTYSALGSETYRNIAFYNSMGLHDQARRCLDFFLEKQHDDGFIQTFERYMIENGAVLWSLSEHYRYTRDKDWLKSIKPKVLRACEYILDQRKKCKADVDGNHLGLLVGKVADPEDTEQSFMLNGYACQGLTRAAEMLADIDPEESKRLNAEALDLRMAIRTAFFEELSRGPVVPLGDGSWAPTVAPWVGEQGPKCLYTDDKPWWSHGSMTTRDDMLGPMHLVMQEVIAPDEEAATFMLNYYSELFYSRNVTFSQPYYSSHPFMHLHRDEPARFLKSYYNTLASLADRETYTFWEHFYHESLHKTAEEAQFLMQTRCMLYLEQGQTLKLLPGVPRAWLEDGKKIELKNAVSYFGSLSFVVTSKLNQGFIEADILCDTDRKPSQVVIRLPHPKKTKATSVTGGDYNVDNETITIAAFSGHAKIKATFAS
jgi:hypothetical protein